MVWVKIECRNVPQVGPGCSRWWANSEPGKACPGKVPLATISWSKLLKDENGSKARVCISPQNGNLLMLLVKTTLLHNTGHDKQPANAAWELDLRRESERAKPPAPGWLASGPGPRQSNADFFFLWNPTFSIKNTKIIHLAFLLSSSTFLYLSP